MSVSAIVSVSAVAQGADPVSAGTETILSSTSVVNTHHQAFQILIVEQQAK